MFDHLGASGVVPRIRSDTWPAPGVSQHGHPGNTIAMIHRRIQHPKKMPFHGEKDEKSTEINGCWAFGPSATLAANPQMPRSCPRASVGSRLPGLSAQSLSQFSPQFCEVKHPCTIKIGNLTANPRRCREKGGIKDK